MLDIPTDLPADIVPLSWLLGVWEGTGVIDYEADGVHHVGEFTHRVSFSHDGGGYLNYSATAVLAATDDAPSVQLTGEVGYWCVARPATAADAGPALLPPAVRGAARTAEDVEMLRTPDGFPIEVSISHSDGILELYLGTIDGPRIDIETDAIVRTAGAKLLGSSSRMYGLVDGHLLWAWDIAALGAEHASHASARLAKVA